MDTFNSLSSMTTEIAVALKKELDEPFKRLLAQSIDNWRSRLIRNSLQTKPNESKFFRQKVYAKMEDGTTTPVCVGAPGCPVRRSVYKIPTPVRFSIQLYDYVGSVDGKTPFSESIPGMGQYQTAGKYSKNNIYWGLDIDGHSFVEGMPNLPYMMFEGVFDRPSEVMQFNCDNGTDCDYWDKQYPVPGDIAQQIIQFIIAGYREPVPVANKEVQTTPQNQEHAPDGR